MEVSPETYYLLALQAFKKRNNVAEKIPELCKFVRAVDLKYLGKFDYMNEGELKTALTIHGAGYARLSWNHDGGLPKRI